MSEVKDSKIKLFGKTIELPEGSDGAVSVQGREDASNQEPPCSSDSMLQDGDLKTDMEEQESCERKDSSGSRPISETPSSEFEAGSEKMIENEDETSSSHDKTLKKPDKIIPCPRCNSMDTKFCYFNNYNVNQPRHFCKNCQRYWTAGGTMRNVPVGAGRRKNKNSVSQFRRLTVPDSPLCESMTSVLNIADKTICNTSRNGFHIPEEVETESRNDSSSRSSTSASSSKDRLPEMESSSQQVPCYAGGPWPYPWNSAASPPASFLMPFYSTTPPHYWACAVPGAWNVPWVISRTPTTSQNHTPPSSGPNSPTLGKHSRDDNIQKVANTEEGAPKEKNLWFPKTLRIDDLGEAAKSSIWATLGIKNDAVGGGGLFKPFQTQSKGDDKSQASTVLQANPAALSRSLSFHERS